MFAPLGAFFYFKKLAFDRCIKQTRGAEQRAGGRGLFGLLSQAVRQEGSVFCSAATMWAFPGEVRDKIEKGYCREVEGNRKVNPGKDGAREPTQHERQRKKLECLGMAQWNTSAGR